ncbi:hypothetical protein [Tenacibaculum amylolyticum]|uniref:hypothetical protein n=1 Tax=Tenacibaculum amylolyticum TaxID=104269 RepID=UPI0038963B1E
MCKRNFNLQFCTCLDKELSNPENSNNKVEEFYNLKAKEAKNLLDTGSKNVSKDEFEKSKKAIKEGKYYDTELWWKLKRFKADRKDFVIGRVIYPLNKLKEDIQFEYILDRLNAGNIFDFNYSPQEKDLIEIWEYYKYKEINGYPREYFENHMVFKYENNKWNFGKFPFGYVFDELNRGKLKVFHNNV